MLEPVDVADVLSVGATRSDLLIFGHELIWEPIGGFADFSDLSSIWEMSTSEWAEAMAACLRSQGILSSADVDGSITTQIPEGSEVIVQAIKLQCEAGLSKPAWRPPTPEEVEMLWEHVTWLAECYRSEGVEAELPSFEQFADDPSWRPPLSDVSHETYLKLAQECPQHPGDRGDR